MCQRLLANTSLPNLMFKVKSKNYYKKKVVSKVNYLKGTLKFDVKV